MVDVMGCHPEEIGWSVAISTRNRQQLPGRDMTPCRVLVMEMPLALANAHLLLKSHLCCRAVFMEPGVDQQVIRSLGLLVGYSHSG